jgi:glucose 1-dehydrogenase
VHAPQDNTVGQVLQGRRAVVTGASSGIGRAIALAFGRAGAAVAVNYASGADRAQAVVEEIRLSGGTAFAAQADVSKPEQCESLFELANQQLGGLDIAVMNAGIQRDARFVDMTVEQWLRVIDVNLTGAFLCAQQAVRQFRRQPRPANAARSNGTLLFISSVHETIPWAGHANYAAAKGGLKLLMRTLAQELAPEGIRVNAIAPGAIRTDINRAAWETAQARDALLKLIPYGRIGEPEDVAKVAVWLASDAADYVVGATLYVDGAMTEYPAFREGG